MNRSKRPMFLLAGLVSCALAAESHAAILVSYLTNDITANVPQPPATLAANASATNLTPAGYSGTSGTHFGFSVTFDNFFALTSITHGYLQFTLSADTGYELDLSNLTVSLGGNTTTSSFTATVSLTSSVLGHATPISGVNTSNVIPAGTSASSLPPFDFQTATFDLSGPVYQNLSSITFRVATGDNVNDPNMAVRIDNLVVNGEVTLIPEPGSLALAGLGGLLIVARRRRA